MNQTNAPSKSNESFKAQDHIKLVVSAGDGAYAVKTDGMRKLGCPELKMDVQQGMFVSAATNILNDVANYVYELKQTDPRPIRKGQRVQVAPWTVIEFKYDDTVTTTPDLIYVVDGVDKDAFN